MRTALDVFLIVIGTSSGLWAGWHLQARRHANGNGVPGARKILLPFTGTSISRRALEAAMRLAHAEGAVIMPAYLACVPRTLPLDAALPQQSALAMPLLEAIEQRAAAKGLTVDARISRGRTYRDALRHIIDDEPVDRIIVSATDNPRMGLSGEDFQWLLRKAPAEVMILRPGPEDHRAVTAASVEGHF
jgi:nucleotide-binding universal stress UspA family protein